MTNLIRKLMRDKREYKQQITRAEALPEDYRFVFFKIHDYIWGYAGGDGSDMMRTQRELLELFEASAAAGRNVLDVTGEDVAAFCEGLLRNTRKWTDSYRRKLNDSIDRMTRERNDRP